ncbi:MAG: hypothetical protein GQF41_1439 [Candidatus Rifleibacterium amylolyticum]|nr:MAG: hypothetical protein GQF41_1439 [Candidatus Rifleibacterium amylolyticum]
MLQCCKQSLCKGRAVMNTVDQTLAHSFRVIILQFYYLDMNSRSG